MLPRRLDKGRILRRDRHDSDRRGSIVLGFGPRLDNSASASRFANATVGAFVRMNDESTSTEIAHGRDVRQRLQARHGRHRQWRQLGGPKSKPYAATFGPLAGRMWARIFFGCRLMHESCCRSCAVNFHFWLWAASSTNV
jgi:hypothetical protein